jgi:homopolymeric O-antigen transport system permease protein
VAQAEVQSPRERIEPHVDAADGDRVEHVTVVRPATSWPRVDLHEVWRYRGLLGIFIWRDLKVRYKQTTVGAAWALFQPLMTAAVYTLVFGRFARFPSGGLPYPIFAFAGVLAWQYFSGALNQGSGSVVSNVPLVTKVYFPRLLLPLGGVLVPLVDLALALVVMIGMMTWYGRWPSWVGLLAPLFILLALVTALGCALGLSALNVRYRDVPYAIPAIMQVMPFLSGVPFALNGVPVKWQWLLSLNPMTTVIAGWRWAILDGPPLVLGQALVSAAVALILLFAGLAYFRRSEPRFADTI